jgi:hypothetical protein
MQYPAAFANYQMQRSREREILLTCKLFHLLLQRIHHGVECQHHLSSREISITEYEEATVPKTLQLHHSHLEKSLGREAHILLLLLLLHDLQTASTYILRCEISRDMQGPLSKCILSCAPNPNPLLLERDRAANPNPSCDSTRERERERERACCLLRNRRSELLIECRSRGGERFCGLLRRRKSESLTIECTRRGAKLAMASRLGTLRMHVSFFFFCDFDFFRFTI